MTKTLEPIALINGTVTLIEAAVAMAVGFGLSWSPEQVALVMAVVVASGNLGKTLWARAAGRHGVEGSAKLLTSQSFGSVGNRRCTACAEF